MAVNPYFNAQKGVASEHKLYEGITVEAIQISGNDYVYLPRTLNKFDQLFGEDTLSSFDSHAVIEMWLEDFSGYGGESEMLAKFGLEVRDTATFIVSRKRFIEEIPQITPTNRPVEVKFRPNEGDLIYVPFSQSLFEIKFVEDEYPGFYQLNKKFVWALRCELVQLNNEKFNTGYPEIDNVFGTNINRLNNAIATEDTGQILGEDGGIIIDEEFGPVKHYDDVVAYGDDDKLKKEFMDIMDFSEDNPFGNN